VVLCNRHLVRSDSTEYVIMVFIVLELAQRLVRIEHEADTAG